MSTKNASWLGGNDAARGLGARNTNGWHHQNANKYNTAFNNGTKKG
ncbi:MAG: hypothetical protein AAFW66_10385 [Pseudomonadota bacterium]